MSDYNMKRVRASLAAATAGLAVAALAALPADAAAAPTVPVRLLALNDFHGHLEPPSGGAGTAIDERGAAVPAGGAAYVAAHLKNLRNANTLTVAQGDLVGASPLISAAYHDEPSVRFLGDVGVTASAVGNHEFDEGYRELLRMQNGGCHPVDGCTPAGRWDGAAFDYLGANVRKESAAGPVPAIRPWTVREVDGVRVGFIGVVTKETPSVVAASGIEGLTFEDEVAAANRAARALRREGVESIVLLVHEGSDVPPTGRPDGCDLAGGPGMRIARDADPAIDAVLSGHTHAQYVCSVPDPAGNPRLYSSGSSFGRVISQVDFEVDRRTGDVVRSSLRGDNHVVTRDVAPDPATQAFVRTWKERVSEKANAPIGRIGGDITRDPSPAGETALGDVIADSQLAAMRDAGGQIAVMNPGSVRTDLVYAASGAEGDGVVTYGEAFAVQPFGNVVGAVTLTGARLDELLEQQWADGDENILQPSANLRFTIDRSRPVGDRVSGITVDGRPVDPATGYRVVANQFLLDGGDGFTVLRDGADRVLGTGDLDAFIAYFEAQGTIDPPELTRISGS